MMCWSLKTTISSTVCHNIVVLVTLMIALNVLVVETGETCRRKDINGNDEVFECPRLFESSKKRFCCGFTPQDKYCCEWSKKSKELVTNPSDLKYLFEGAVALIIIALLVIGGLIVCCCLCACCLMSRKKQQRGRVLGHNSADGGTSLTTVPNSYPVQNAYPMQNVTAPYPSDQPPPYNYSQTQPAFNPNYPPYPVVK
ncbi:protein shisa-5-like [Oppia nitens]|uniref:protein shisa-5-like n=1 Tax=Oppia nitens TaxID=1686743 RepID=UPI0023DB1506|nr:protein shisa-5-like [Oppia nitens]